MDTLQTLAVILAGVMVLSLMSNQVGFAVLLLCVTIVGLALYFWSQKSKHDQPYTRFRQNLMKECFDPNNALGYLLLSGGDEDGISHQERVRGKILGWTKLSSSDPLLIKDKSVWRTLYVFLYEPRGKSFTVKNLLKQLPLIGDSFREYRFFAVNPSQLGQNSLTSGDIVINGTSVTTVACLEMINTKDLDKDIHLNTVNKDVKRLVIEGYFDKEGQIIDRAVLSDSDYLKTWFLSKDKDDFGIKGSS